MYIVFLPIQLISYDEILLVFNVVVEFELMFIIDLFRISVKCQLQTSNVIFTLDEYQ